MIKGLEHVLRVSVHSQIGGRKYMEDDFAIAYQSSQHVIPTTSQVFDYVYFGVFDGHGGKEASEYTKLHLLDNIFKQDYFWSNNDELILKAIKKGFISTHLAMMKELINWPKTSTGLPSTAGTTASVIFLMNHKYYIGHVGDSRIVIGQQTDKESFWVPHAFTEDHTPNCPLERKRIQQAGGKILNKSGIERIVWSRPINGHQGPVRRSTHFEEIPFLAVARSLGDFWSYNSDRDVYIVSPEPDVSVVSINYNNDKCIVLASDGLWNVMKPFEVMLHLQEVFKKVLSPANNNNCDYYSSYIYQINPAQTLVESALERWKSRNLKGDNTTAIVVYLDHLEFLNQKSSGPNSLKEINTKVNNTLTPIILSGSKSYNFVIDVNQPLFLEPKKETSNFLLEMDRCTQIEQLNSNLESNYCQYFSNFKHSKLGLNPKKTLLNSNFLNEISGSNLQKTLKDDTQFENIWNLKNVTHSHSNQISYSKSSFQEENENKVSNSQNCFSKSISGLKSNYISLNRKILSTRKKLQKKKLNLFSLNLSPPSKHLRSSKWSRAKFQSHIQLTKLFTTSIVTKSRLRARHFNSCK